MNEAKRIRVKVVKTAGIYSLHSIDYVVPSDSYVAMPRIDREVWELYFSRKVSPQSSRELELWQYLLECCYHGNAGAGISAAIRGILELP